jgi:glycosyltransferase involved in cell wall biosynthesis
VSEAPRIAFFSPLPPEPSGIADYSAGLLAELAEHCDLSVYTRDPARARRQLPPALAVHAYDEYQPGNSSSLPVYQIGNHDLFHGAIYERALEQPGLVVLHELVLHDLVRDHAMRRAGPAAYREELRYALGATGEALGRRVERNGERLAPHLWPLFERLVDRSRGALVHSLAARSRLLASRPLADVTVTPHYALDLAPQPEAVLGYRQRMGIAADSLVLGSFGIAAESKRLELVVRVFRDLVPPGREKTLLLLGSGAEEVRRQALQAGIEPNELRTPGRVPEEELRLGMAATDVAFNLRHPNGWETSGSCLRLLALGRAVVVTDEGWFSEIPADCCAHVAADADEEQMLTGLVAELANAPDLRRSMGRNAREWALEQHSPRRAVDGYLAAIERALDAAAPDPPTPPLAAWPREDVVTELIAELTAAAGDLGIREDDHPLLAELAQTVAALTGDDPRPEPRRPAAERDDS